MRRLVCLFLITLLPLQALASQGSLAFMGHAEDMLHELLHDDQPSHHHHEDGTVHFDESPESMEHASDHCVCVHQFSLLPSNEWPGVSLTVLTRLGEHAFERLPDPLADNPHKPPKHAT